MEFIEYRDLPDQGRALDYLKQIEWGAGRHLAGLLARDAFRTEYGPDAGLHFVVDDGAFIGFGAITDKDYLPRPLLKPWIAFVYVDPRARGQRLSAQIVGHLEACLARRGVDRVYLVSQHLGLYEKYGYELLESTDEGIHERDHLYGKTLG